MRAWAAQRVLSNGQYGDSITTIHTDHQRLTLFDFLIKEYLYELLQCVQYISLPNGIEHTLICPLLSYTSLLQLVTKMVYCSASSIDMLHGVTGTSGVQKPKRRRKYVPHHMRSEESALKRNARERRRQGRINDALDRLNLHLPQTGPGDRKAGKEGIIRRAIDYIQTLSSILGQAPKKLPLSTVRGNPVEIPEPSPEFQPLPAELFGQLMLEAQHWISATQVTPLMTSSPNSIRIPATDCLHSEYLISDRSPGPILSTNVHNQSSGEESGYFDCLYDDIYSPYSSSGSSAADDIVDELFSSDSFASDISKEHLASFIDIDTFVWEWQHLAILWIAIPITKWSKPVLLHCIVCWDRMDIYFHLPSLASLYMFPSHIVLSSYHQRF